MLSLEPPFPPPSGLNDFLAAHARSLRLSYRRLVGCDLVDSGLADAEAARALFEAPFAVLSHGLEPDPILSYANRAALDLFELDWGRLVAMPSRLTAQSPERADRERLLAGVRERGFVDGYSGIRISSTGRRFRILDGLVWTLADEMGRPLGQAARLGGWQYLED